MIDIELLGMIDIHTYAVHFFPNDSRSGDESFVAVAVLDRHTCWVMVYMGKHLEKIRRSHQPIGLWMEILQWTTFLF